MSSQGTAMNPPRICLTVGLECGESCPLATCLEDMMQPRRNGEHGMNALMAAFSANWPEARARRAGRAAFVAAANKWLADTVLPEARKVLAGESRALNREQARALVAILG